MRLKCADWDDILAVSGESADVTQSFISLKCTEIRIPVTEKWEREKGLWMDREKELDPEIKKKKIEKGIWPAYEWREEAVRRRLTQAVVDQTRLCCHLGGRSPLFYILVKRLRLQWCITKLLDIWYTFIFQDRENTLAYKEDKWIIKLIFIYLFIFIYSQNALRK